MIDVEGQRGAVKLHNGYQQGAECCVSKGQVVRMLCAGGGGREVDGGTAGAKTGRERREEAVIELVGAMGESTDVVSLRHGRFRELQLMGGGVEYR